MVRKLMLATVLAATLALGVVGSGEAAGPRPPRPDCCACYLEIRPPRYWNGRLINKPLPRVCQRACGRR